MHTVGPYLRDVIPDAQLQALCQGLLTIGQALVQVLQDIEDNLQRKIEKYQLEKNLQRKLEN